MKPKQSTLIPNAIALTALVVGLINYAPPPPAGGDILFRLGWYVGHYVGLIENLFR